MNNQWKEEWKKKVSELKEQRPAHLRESEPVEFGYTVDRDDEIFRVVDFGNIEKYIENLLSSQLQEVVGKIEKTPELQTMSDGKVYRNVLDREKVINLITNHDGK